MCPAKLWARLVAELPAAVWWHRAALAAKRQFFGLPTALRPQRTLAANEPQLKTQPIFLLLGY
jgi:hypothetical protein